MEINIEIQTVYIYISMMMWCCIIVMQSYGRGPVEPLSDYHADNSRSDLSDILEEEEEDLYSDHLGEVQARGYTVGASRVK